MQFAGQRTTLDLKPVGDPVNILVKLSDDILPEPFAITVTGITPQMTLSDGLSEPEFVKMLTDDVFTPGTVAVGYNNIRFDDEFVRHTLWRNFYDPYEWAWADGRGRWDMLDVVRMTRALRPDGVTWPHDDKGKPVNKLELLAKANNLLHTKAHDALSDVEALIGLARLLKSAQPKLFDYLLRVRDKKEVAKLVNLERPEPFVYSSGRYNAAFDYTSVAFPISVGTKPGSVLVYDLRYDPTPFLGATPQALASILFADRSTREQKDFTPLPVKELAYTKCPAVAPLGVFDEASQQRLSLPAETIQKHWNILVQHPAFGEAVRTAFEMREPYEPSHEVEDQLYNGFTPDQDKVRVKAVQGADADSLADLHPQFSDERLGELLFRYKARWYPASLSEQEHQTWEDYRAQKISAGLPKYLETLQNMAHSSQDTYLLEELQLWAESIAPE